MSSQSHYEERMEADLAEIRAKIRKVSALVEAQMHDAVQALLTGDVELANKVVLGDRQVNRRIRDIDRLVHAFIVRHAPSAGHLRFASAVLRLDVSLERIGDYAGTIGREVAQFSGQPPASVRRDFELLGQQARQALTQALNGFHSEDPDAATKTYGFEGQLDHTLRAVLGELLDVGERRDHPLRDIFALLRVAVLIRRVAGQAANIAEQTGFWLTGQTRDSRIFRVLFVGHKNDRASQIAEAYARKAYPESGSYSSAGVHPADHLDPALIAFMDAKGLDVRNSAATELKSVDDQSLHFHVIVCLEPGVRQHIGDVPFRTVVLDWKLDLPDGVGADAMEEVYREVAVRVQGLMTTLAGPDAR
ncbi:MAG: hypothetical protein O2958_12670 [Gemmatimonadetes bacterium]|nr:hypothetical protein [Gemmatimonadota bacterium]MDA1103176.1 hypothetical protein [Gemmatimonadota bacterium]